MPEGRTACSWLVLGLELGWSDSKTCVLNPRAALGQRMILQHVVMTIGNGLVCIEGEATCGHCGHRPRFLFLHSCAGARLALVLTWAFPINSLCFCFLVCEMKGHPIFFHQIKGTGKADGLGKCVFALIGFCARSPCILESFLEPVHFLTVSCCTASVWVMA